MNVASVHPRTQPTAVLSGVRALLSFPAVLAAGLVFLTFWACATRFDDPDLWWNLKLGQDIWSSHAIPRADQYSFTALGHPFIAHEWLSQVILYGAYLAGGYRGLHLYLSVLASAIVLLSYLLAYKWSRNAKVSFLAGILALSFLTVSLAPRPILIGHLCLVSELLVLAYWLGRVRRGIWALPVVFAFWANCHPSFLFGMALFGVILAWRCVRLRGGLRWRCGRAITVRVGLLVVLCVAAPFVNAVGPSLVTYPVSVFITESENLKFVQEWYPLDLHDPRTVLLGACVGLVVMASIAGWAVIRPVEWMLLAIGVGMAIPHARMLPIFGFLAAPVVCRILAAWWDHYDAGHDHPLLNGACLAGALALCVAVTPSTSFLEQQISADEPVQAVAALQKQGLRGPLLNDYAWGGYLMWFHPSERVFIDPRFDIFAWTGVFAAYGRWAMLQEDPRLLLDKYGIQTCLIRATSPMARVLPYLPGWRRVHEDKLAAVFTRQN